MTDSKVCSKCGEEKLLTTENYYKCKNNKDGFYGECKNCSYERGKEYRKKNIEKVREYQRQWARKKYWQDPERAREAGRAWYWKNHEKAKKALMKYHWKNKEKKYAYRKEYYQKNKAKELEDKKLYFSKYPERRRQAEAKRKALKLKNAVGDVSYSYIMERDKMTCHICGKKVNKDELNFDHVIPLSKGGLHSNENIKVSHAFCNMNKGDKLID